MHEEDWTLLQAVIWLACHDEELVALAIVRPHEVDYQRSVANWRQWAWWRPPSRAAINAARQNAPQDAGITFQPKRNYSPPPPGWKPRRGLKTPRPPGKATWGRAQRKLFEWLRDGRQLSAGKYGQEEAVGCGRWRGRDAARVEAEFLYVSPALVRQLALDAGAAGSNVSDTSAVRQPPMVTGDPGRPSKSFQLYEDKFKRRVRDGTALRDLSAEAKYLREWLKGEHPLAALPTLKTIKNRLRELHRAYKDGPKLSE